MFAGFSEAQAESLTMSLVEIITSSVLNVTDSTVSKIDQVCTWLIKDKCKNEQVYHWFIKFMNKITETKRYVYLDTSLMY